MSSTASEPLSSSGKSSLRFLLVGGQTHVLTAGANLMGADLYKNLQNYFTLHLKKVRADAEDLSGEPLLKYYTQEWKRYTTGASYINRLFFYLNRHWIKREKDEGRKNVYTVYTVSCAYLATHGA
jgi:cullin 1